MSLGIEWFAGSDARNRQREAEGVSIKEAEASLFMYHSTAYPVATELAEWLYRNWSFRDFLRLKPESRDLLLKILEKECLLDA
jgi:hypothetical protein